ncbi:MAG: hypothetical protein OHK0045_06470 [Raineya sp.]
MFSDSQLHKIEALKEQFGLSNYQALQILMEQEKTEALRSIATLMMGSNVAGMMNNFFQKDFSNTAENISNLLGAFFQKSFKNPQDSKKPSDRDDD